MPPAEAHGGGLKESDLDRLDRSVIHVAEPFTAFSTRLGNRGTSGLTGTRRLVCHGIADA